MKEAISRRSFLELSGVSLATVGAGLTLKVGEAYPPSTTRTIRLAVVGGGFGSEFYWHEHPNCHVACVSDLRPERRTRLQQVYRCGKAYDSLEAMLRVERNIDAVAIFTGAPDHARHVKWCLERDLHVISAVPACVTLEEAEMLRSVKEETGLRYMMAETSYYRQPTILVRELYRQGRLGEIFYTEAEYYHDRGSLERLITDRETRFYEPGGRRSWRWGFPPLLYPTHAVGFVVGVTRDRISRVSALGWGRPNHPWLTENSYGNPFWNETSLMQTQSGRMVRCNVFWITAPEGERASWFGDKAAFYMPNRGLHAETLLVREKGGEPIEVPVYWETDMLPPAMRHNSGHGGSHTFLSAEFINALIGDREPAVDIYESLAMTVPGIVAHQSALGNGEQLLVPNFDPDQGT